MDILHLDFLFVAGEIGIAFTGFAGLVTVLAGRLAPAGDVDPSLARLSIVLFSSLLLVMSALLPYVLHQILEPTFAWMISAITLSVFLGIFVHRGMILPALQIKKSGRPFNPVLFYFTTTITVASALGLIVSVIIPEVRTSSVYTIAIYVLVWVSASMLYRLFVLLASKEGI